jgi:hypothetical protein
LNMAMHLRVLSKAGSFLTSWVEVSGGIGPRILNLGTIWRWVVSFTPGRFTSMQRAFGTHWVGDWVGARAGLDTVAKRKTPYPCQESNPGHPQT